MKKLLLSALAILLLAAAPAMANTVYTVQFIGPGGIDQTVYDPGVGSNVYAGPYNITVNGMPFSEPCLTWDVIVASTWDAYLDPLTSISSSFQTPLREMEWLNLQFASHLGEVGAM